MNNLLKGSWKTTVLGIVTILGAISDAAKALLDSDPATNFNYAVTAALIAGGIGLIKARDNNVSSEDAGAK